MGKLLNGIRRFQKLAARKGKSGGTNKVLGLGTAQRAKEAERRSLRAKEGQDFVDKMNELDDGFNFSFDADFMDKEMIPDLPDLDIPVSRYRKQGNLISPQFRLLSEYRPPGDLADILPFPRNNIAREYDIERLRQHFNKGFSTMKSNKKV